MLPGPAEGDVHDLLLTHSVGLGQNLLCDRARGVAVPDLADLILGETRQAMLLAGGLGPGLALLAEAHLQSRHGIVRGPTGPAVTALALR